ncbi:uncharacterized protein N7479_008934 [Penicillium vulpinum]|uniref:uncharacterized protein n=1 Tax=Penicillium vulpinum TaxID=29845 RepID=UPI0025487DC0|nr:uncharacterized protein N7479_008934 [Penicillium vulpinum]KAJ5950521.1 hypothetical protein N7479_008934 [Penicillium vulpinum]
MDAHFRYVRFFLHCLRYQAAYPGRSMKCAEKFGDIFLLKCFKIAIIVISGRKIIKARAPRQE